MLKMIAALSLCSQASQAFSLSPPLASAQQPHQRLSAFQSMSPELKAEQHAPTTPLSLRMPTQLRLLHGSSIQTDSEPKRTRLQSHSVPDSADGSVYEQRLNHLRDQFTDQGLDGVLIPRTNEYFTEAVPACHERLSFMTGFTGSSGLALIQKESAHLIVNGIYELQAPQQVNNTLINCISTRKTPVTQVLLENIPANSCVGYDPQLHTSAEIENYKNHLRARNIDLVPLSKNPVDAIRSEEHLEFPSTPVVQYPTVYAGASSEEKLKQLNTLLKEKRCDSAVLSLPESICWLLNVRGDDIPHTPLVLSNAIIHRSKDNLSAMATVDWFVGKSRIDTDLETYLPDSVNIYEREQFQEILRNLSGQRVLVDPKRCSTLTVETLNLAGAFTIPAEDISLLPKAIKNPTEISGTRRAHIRDGVAVTRFAAWLAEQSRKADQQTALTELDCVKKIHQLRSDSGHLKDLSFATIAGAGENGAIVHYSATDETNRALSQGELLLLDSGGQYLDGTTDITRTFAFGEPSDEMRAHYTLVLQGHIQLARSKFSETTSGSKLDQLARSPLKSAGLDYAHGTGHGVGIYLGVHEGPQSISPRATLPLKAGMLLSNEPGYYKEGHYGIRLENIVLVKDIKNDNIDGSDQLHFETISLAPFDRNLIDADSLSDSDLTWLNEYHEKVEEQLLPKLLSEKDQLFLKRACAPIEKTSLRHS